jgi:hypothetical protein
MRTFIFVFCTVTILAFAIPAEAQRDNLDVYNEQPSRLRGVIEKYGEDYGSINRFYTAQTSSVRSVRFRQLYSEYLSWLEQVNFNTLLPAEQVDYVLFRNYLEHEQKELTRFEKQLEEMAPILPFGKSISIWKTRGAVSRLSIRQKAPPYLPILRNR